VKSPIDLKLIGSLMKSPKYCRKCGYQKDSQKEDNWVCKECEHKNYKLSLKKYLKLRKIEYKRCKKCEMIIKGIIIRKDSETTTLQYKCSNCGFETESNWTTIW